MYPNDDSIVYNSQIWKQPKNPTDEWIKKEWCIYIRNEILPSHKKE